MPKGPRRTKNSTRSKFTTRTIFSTAGWFTIAARLVRTPLSWELQTFFLSKKGSIFSTEGSFRWWKTAPLKRPIKRSMSLEIPDLSEAPKSRKPLRLRLRSNYRVIGNRKRVLRVPQKIANADNAAFSRDFATRHSLSGFRGVSRTVSPRFFWKWKGTKKGRKRKKTERKQKENGRKRKEKRTETDRKRKKTENEKIGSDTVPATPFAKPRVWCSRRRAYGRLKREQAMAVHCNWESRGFPSFPA